MLEKGQTGPKPKVLENSPDDDFARPVIDDFSPAGGRGAACPMARSGGTVGQPDWLGLGMPKPGHTGSGAGSTSHGWHATLGGHAG